jgi:hypothetical protein
MFLFLKGVDIPINNHLKKNCSCEQKDKRQGYGEVGVKLDQPPK